MGHLALIWYPAANVPQKRQFGTKPLAQPFAVQKNSVDYIVDGVHAFIVDPPHDWSLSCKQAPSIYSHVSNVFLPMIGILQKESIENFTYSSIITAVRGNMLMGSWERVLTFSQEVKGKRQNCA